MELLINMIMIFVVAVIVLGLFFYAYRIIFDPNSAIIQKRLETLATSQSGDASTVLLKTRALSDVPFLNKILFYLPGIRRLERLVRQANTQYPVGFYVLLSMVILVTGFYLSVLVTKNSVSSILIAIISAATPSLYLRLKKKRRMEKFRRQLPEGLELIARALKAGHAFTSGLQLAAEEFDDPFGPEFERVLNEINFGSSVVDALKNLTTRVDCPDLKYFVISVIIQRETGGNLAEIIESIAHLIRKRFRFQGKIRTLSAEGKISAKFLIAIPILIVVTLHFTSPDYIEVLLSEPVGKKLMAVAGFMMLIGVVIMRRMVNIKV